ncbi:extracellular solute-binding protein, family 3 [Pseudomonas sp. URIL14HWK12:I9]|nr:ABC-type amino acid transport substrate-binding protein [Pseudomonas sp. URIL14HWK12:I12]PVZ22480.1 ABC-type amino acid transport substrate-binding protein [Pseudomonas sp. URIL14HWK12:I10]PVZ31396.1 ABC-type amino acid transport substrate-binding protein [Pseudomonas sp. URIL14HWK12:I11]SNZ16144.1 extracellular solute-binding protein, family 3 [Pseudomonas sp. URIL14HWK12:I9]
MAKWIWLVLLMSIPLLGRAEPATVRVVSKEWADYTNADGTGLAWDLLRAIFEPAGYRVQPRTDLYVRSLGLVREGHADIWVGSYQKEREGLYPRWNYDIDHIYALRASGKPAPDRGRLGDYRLAWVYGYELQRYLPGVRSFQEVQRRTGILQMLDKGRIDYYVDALSEIDVILQAAANPQDYRLSHLAELPLYLGFANTADGQRLREVFDRRMDELVPAGALRPIFGRWRQPYPFEGAARPGSSASIGVPNNLE